MDMMTLNRPLEGEPLLPPTTHRMQFDAFPHGHAKSGV